MQHQEDVYTSLKSFSDEMLTLIERTDKVTTLQSTPELKRLKDHSKVLDTLLLTLEDINSNGDGIYTEKEVEGFFFEANALRESVIQSVIIVRAVLESAAETDYDSVKLLSQMKQFYPPEETPEAGLMSRKA